MYRNRLSWLIALTSVFAIYSYCNAQNTVPLEEPFKKCCCYKDLTPSGVMISHVHAKKEWMFSYRFMSMNMRGNQQGQTQLQDLQVFNDYLMLPTHMNMQMHMLMAMYGVSNRFTLMAMLNINTTTMDMSMMPGTTHIHNGVASTSMEHAMHTQGLGDTKIHALYNLLNKETYQLIVSTGLSLPTGNIGIVDHGSMYNGRRLPYAMQLGSGSYELLPSFTLLHDQGIWAWSVQGSAITRLNTNSLGYRRGNEWMLNSWIAYSFLSWLSVSARGECTAVGVMQGNDFALYQAIEPAANAANYGGTFAQCVLGINVYLDKLLPIRTRTRIAAEYGMPLYQDFHGVQMPVTSQLNLSLNINL